MSDQAYRTSRHQHDLPDILSLFEIAVRLAGIVKRESLIDVRVDPFFFDATQNVAHPHRDLLRLVPHVAQVQTKHAAILVEQRQTDETTASESPPSTS